MKLKIEPPVFKFEIGLFGILVQLIDAASTGERQRMIELSKELSNLALDFPGNVGFLIFLCANLFVQIIFSFFLFGFYLFIYYKFLGN